jgi:hypothetical protein
MIIIIINTENSNLKINDCGWDLCFVSWYCYLVLISYYILWAVINSWIYAQSTSGHEFQ